MERVNNEEEKEKSFAELLEESSVDRSKGLRPGQAVEAEIVKITGEWAFLNLDGKTEGYLDRKEITDESGNPTAHEGEKIKVYFLEAHNNEKHFTTRITGGLAARSFLEDAWKGGVPIEGIVDKEVKGGFQVRIAGNTRAFCPFSQMALSRIENASEYIGKRLNFVIIDYAERGRNIIVSHRSILEKEQAVKREVLKGTLREGMAVTGRITSLQKFGAFIDLGGIQGLIPMSEISWSQVKDINSFLSVGQEVEAVVIRIDWEKNRIALSLKQAQPDPWEQVEEKYPEGSFHTGHVTRLADFGAFVELEPGIDGLIHISKLSGGKKLKHSREALAQDQSVEVKIEKVDKPKKRISLALAGGGQGEGRKDEFDQYIDKGSPSLGSLGDILKGKIKPTDEK